MWFTKQADGFRGWLTLKRNNGLIITGAVSGDFTVTVVDPTDTNTTSPTVNESTAKPGLYTFLIPSSFFTTNGNGGYGVVVEIDKNNAPRTQDTISKVLRVFTEDFDTIAEAVLTSLVDGTIDVRTALTRINAMARGKITLSGAQARAPQDAVYFEEDDSTVSYTNRNTGDERNPL